MKQELWNNKREIFIRKIDKTIEYSLDGMTTIKIIEKIIEDLKNIKINYEDREDLLSNIFLYSNPKFKVLDFIRETDFYKEDKDIYKNLYNELKTLFKNFGSLFSKSNELTETSRRFLLSVYKSLKSRRKKRPKIDYSGRGLVREYGLGRIRIKVVKEEIKRRSIFSLVKLLNRIEDYIQLFNYNRDICCFYGVDRFPDYISKPLNIKGISRLYNMKSEIYIELQERFENSDTIYLPKIIEVVAPIRGNVSNFNYKKFPEGTLNLEDNSFISNVVILGLKNNKFIKYYLNRREEVRSAARRALKVHELLKLCNVPVIFTDNPDEWTDICDLFKKIDKKEERN